MGDLGDLSNFMKEGGVANLDWLDVNEQEYREEARLPKQNLDIAPDLQALWAHEDKASTTYLEPNTGAAPRTMADLGPNGNVRAKAEDILKTARVALMVTPTVPYMREQLLRRFTLDDLRANREVLASALEERGFLGKVYIAASDFPGCHNAPKVATTFVRRHACDAKYVQAKPECGSCVHAQKIGQSTNCAVFHKEVVFDVPYTEQLATEVENLQQLRGKTIQASTQTLAPKERIRLAVLNEGPVQAPAVYTGVGLNQLPQPVKMTTETAQEQLIAASSLVRKKSNDDRLSLKAKPIVAFLRREMLKSRSSADLVKNLKVAFPFAALAETRAEWAPVFYENGLYGSVYSTQESFDECRDGADFLAKHNPGVRAMVAGAKCDSCIYNKISRCMLYGKPLVKQASDVFTWETVEAVIQEHKTAGRLQPWETKTASYGQTPREALKSIHNRVLSASGPQYAPGRLDVFHAWSGGSQGHVASGHVKREIVKTATKYLNEGLYGRDLLAALKARFEVRDLTAAAPELKPVVAEQGLAGIYYVDPSVYDDYGHGCKEASRLFRARQVPYVKAQSKCGSCVHNHNNHCSQLNKPIVVEPPYVDKKAQQAAILATGPAMENDPAKLINSGLTMMAEYQLQNGGMEVDLDPVREEPKVAVEIGKGKVKL